MFHDSHAFMNTTALFFDKIISAKHTSFITKLLYNDTMW